MKKTMLFMAVALIVGAASAFSPTFNPTGWYNDNGGAHSGPTDQGVCSIFGQVNCSVTDANGIVHTPIYDSQTHIGNAAFILKYNP
jgi:hypothetical protein